MTEKHLEPKSAIEETKNAFKGVNKTRADGLVLLNEMSKIQDVNKELYQRVYENKTWVRSEPDEESGVDFGMFNYILSLPHIFDSSMNRFETLQAFWKQLWPHLENFLNDYDRMAAAFDANLLETDDIIKNHVDVVYEAKIQEAYFEKFPTIKEDYEKFKAELEKTWEDAQGVSVSEQGEEGSQES